MMFVISVTNIKGKVGWSPKKVYIAEKNLILRVRSAKENDSRQCKPTSMLQTSLKSTTMIYFHNPTQIPNTKTVSESKPKTKI